MPNSKKDHEALRKVICAICWYESGQKASVGVSGAQEAALRDYVVSSYSIADPRFPAGLCKNCSFILRDWISGVENPRALPVASRYDAVIPMTTRSSPQCTFIMCKLGRLNGLEWRRFSISKKQQKHPPIAKNSGERLCATCFSRIYRGSNHSAEACRSSMSGVSPAILEKVVHDHPKTTVMATGDASM